MPLDYPSLSWLLEEENPGVRFLALKDLVKLTPDDPKLIKAKKAAYAHGPIAEVLEHMNPEGYWQKLGGGYSPKYFSAVWSLILLSQLGASASDDTRIKTACSYYLDHAISKDGSFSYNATPSGTIDCLNGNMCAALTSLGYADERLESAFVWMAKSVIGEKDFRYYCYKCGPDFACGPNGKKSCAWGAVKVLLAFGKLPAERRTPVILEATERGVSFLLGTDPLTANYPTAYNTKPNGSWWKFGFPVYYITDLLQLTEALISVGCGRDPRLKNTIEYIKEKQDKEGKWPLEYDYKGKTWGNFGIKRKPSKWVTYRALKVLNDM